MLPAKTTEEIQATPLANINPEFIRIPDAYRLFGLKRGTLYNLLQDGRIKGVLLRSRGAKSGVRLINTQSVRDYITSCQN